VLLMIKLFLVPVVNISKLMINCPVHCDTGSHARVARGQLVMCAKTLWHAANIFLVKKYRQNLLYNQTFSLNGLIFHSAITCSSCCYLLFIFTAAQW